MRSLWAGAISFGLVTIPVRLYPATHPREVAFRQVHREDGGKISFRRVCLDCGREVPYAGVAKGYERPGGDVVMLSDEELASLPRERAHRIEVRSFTRAHEIDPLLVARSYYLEPAGSATGAYVVFREALRRAGKVAVVTVTLRQREALAGLSVRGGVLVLQTLLSPGEVTGADFPFLAAGAGPRPPEPEVTMATALIDAMTQRFDPAAHHDRYREELDALSRTKVSGAPGQGPPDETPEQVSPDGAPEQGPPEDTPEQGFPDDELSEPGTPEPDLAESLRASLAAARYRQAPVLGFGVVTCESGYTSVLHQVRLPAVLVVTFKEAATK